MSEICNRSLCTGCMACYNSCRKGAIVIKENNEGFLSPEIDQSTCVNCGLCKKICPANNPIISNEPKKIFACWSKNEDIRKSSSSGGAFWELASSVIKSGGYVAGCVLDNKLKARHIIVGTLTELEQLKGSKYSQSIIGKIYIEVHKLLLHGQTVLFSGTPCQIAGLKNYLQKDFDNLITVDLVCHGVPSPLLFEDYKEYIKKEKGFKRIDSIVFRGKKRSWMLYNMQVEGVDSEDCKLSYSGHYLIDPWIRGFLGDNFLRKSCYNCQYANISRVSDFTIADWWSFKPKDGDYSYLQKGVSSMTCNTERAISFFSTIKDSFYLESKSLEDYKTTNPSLSSSWKEPDSRVLFWSDYNNYGFSKALIKKYMNRKPITLTHYIEMRYKNHVLIRLLLKILYKKNALLKHFNLDNLQIKF